MRLLFVANAPQIHTSTGLAFIGSVSSRLMLRQHSLGTQSEKQLNHSVVTRTRYSLPQHVSLNMLKCVVVGDAASGKTCLLSSYIQDLFPKEYSPTMCDNYSINTVDKEGKPLRVDFIDTAGQEDFARLRTSCYVGTNVFLLCFSASSPSSYENISKKWFPEISTHCPKALIVLAATKIDLRDDKDTVEVLRAKKLKPITSDQGKAKRKEISAVAYVECSAKTNKNVKSVFEEVVKAEAPGFLKKIFFS